MNRLAGNMNAATVSATHSRIIYALETLSQQSLCKSDKEALLGRLRRDADLIGFHVPPYNSTDFAAIIDPMIYTMKRVRAYEEAVA